MGARTEFALLDRRGVAYKFYKIRSNAAVIIYGSAL